MVNQQQLQIPNRARMLYVIFSAEINPNTAEALIAVMSRAAMQSVQAVTLYFSTPGGNVREGITLYNMLKGMPFELTIHNSGSVDSIGNAVFMAGEHRYATAISSFLFHGVGYTINNQRLEEKQLRERLDSIHSDQAKIGDIIISDSNLTDTEVAELFLEQQTKDTTWAIDKGVINEVRDIHIPSGSPIVSLVFQR